MQGKQNWTASTTSSLTAHAAKLFSLRKAGELALRSNREPLLELLSQHLFSKKDIFMASVAAE